MTFRFAITALALLLLSTPAVAQEPIRLTDPQQPDSGWSFGDGPEFPGARSFQVDELSASRLTVQPHQQRVERIELATDAVGFHLADRIGLRQLGVWGGWSPKPPYKPTCPGIDLCRELGAKWITGTPASRIERNGFDEYSEESLRQGMKNFLEAYADKGLAMIALGNEPHGTGDKVLENVRAYRAIYETVKQFDPKIHVKRCIATAAG